MSPMVQTPESQHHIFTVGDAQEQFRNSTEQTTGYRDLITLLIDTGFDKPFQNDSYFDALVLTDVMFRRSKQSVEILTGPALDGFLCELKESFIELLKRLKEVGGKVRIIVLCDKKPEQLKTLELMRQFPDTLNIAFGTQTKPLQHFIVCDSRIVRVENIHEPITKSTRADEIKAEVYFNDPQKARTLKTFFNAVWTTLKPEKALSAP